MSAAATCQPEPVQAQLPGPYLVRACAGPAARAAS